MPYCIFLIDFYVVSSLQHRFYALFITSSTNCIGWRVSSDSFNNWREQDVGMVTTRMTGRSRRYFKKIQRSNTRYELQELSSTIQSDLDKRKISYDAALNLGNIIQNRADQLPGDAIVYSISDRDAYRRTLELYLRDSLLTKTEQLLLWEERRRLGISDADHERLLVQLVAQWKRQGKKVTIDQFRNPGGESVA